MMNKSEMDLVKVNGESAQKKAYSQRVTALIREKYSLSAELAIQRQRDDKVVEFAEYNAYAEACKVQAHEEIYGE